MTSNSGIERILVITAHPDDLDFGAGGTIASWVRQGIEVSYCICTDGDAGGFDPTVPRVEIPRIRQAEQRAAAGVYGVTDIHFLGYPDGRLTPSIELRRDISRVIRQVRPQRVLTQSPEIWWDRVYASHPDHRAAGEAAFCAVYPDARNPFAHVELATQGYEAWTVPQMWIMASPHPTTYVDITDTFELKLAALRAHESQTAHMEDLRERLESWSQEVSSRLEVNDGRLIEAFQVVNTA